MRTRIGCITSPKHRPIARNIIPSVPHESQEKLTAVKASRIISHLFMEFKFTMCRLLLHIEIIIWNSSFSISEYFVEWAIPGCWLFSDDSTVSSDCIRLSSQLDKTIAFQFCLKLFFSTLCKSRPEVRESAVLISIYFKQDITVWPCNSIIIARMTSKQCITGYVTCNVLEMLMQHVILYLKQMFWHSITFINHLYI